MARLPIIAAPSEGPPLPTVRALDGLWQQIAARPLWAPPRFWRYVRLRARMRLRFVDAARTPLSGPSGKVNDCQSCTDICCVGPRATVQLRLRDVATLHDLGRGDLMTHRKPTFSEDELAQRPALRRNTAAASWEVFPVLRQDSMGACAALDRDGKCGLYPHWPLSCARFPYALHVDDGDVFYSRRCQSFWTHPKAAPRAARMAAAAVAAYNERIKDQIMLAFAPAALEDLGLARYLRL